MPIRKRIQRAALGLPILLAVVGCTDGGGDGADTMRIEDLGNDVLYVISETEPFTRFEGDAEGFLERLGFAPVYPGVLPHQYRLSSAYIGRDPTGGEGQVALSLQYVQDARNSDLISIGQFLQDGLPNASTTAAPIGIGDADGWILHHHGTETFTLAWHSCDRVITIQSDAIEVDEAISIAESIECPDTEG